ncbi:hypothetical protein LP420_23015 [Massilia sp. B-10]|nr:hypothetical protein LP420_23015 [Massilia sp. B-10]
MPTSCCLATTQLEHVDAHKAYGHLYMMANNAAIAPLGEAKPNTEIFRLIAARMGFTDPVFQESDDQIAAQAFDGRDARHQCRLGIAQAQRLAKAGHAGCAVRPGRLPYAVRQVRVLFGQHARRRARSLADPHSALRIGCHQPGTGGKISTGHDFSATRNFLNSSFVNVTSLRATEGEPRLDIHPDDGAARGITDGEMVRIFNDRGSFVAKARITSKARAGLVVGLSVWWKKLATDGKNANEVTSQALTDMGRAPTFYDTLVQVEKLPA